MAIEQATLVRELSENKDMNSNAENRKQLLLKIWEAAVSSVSGQQAVEKALREDKPFQPDLVLAVGKAAVGMCRGALNKISQPCEALIVTKYDHADEDILNRERVSVIESAHPIPDQQSLFAGATLLERVKAMGDETRLLLLVSGGASALAEALPEGMNLADLQAIADAMISNGKTIGQINARRKETSLTKDGKLIEQFTGAELRVYAISDVEGDNIATIGSGLGDCHRAVVKASSKIIASNTTARQCAVEAGQKLGLMVKLNEESLYGDVFELSRKIGLFLADADAGLYIWGGEPTIILPETPGQGGRNQSLALALAEHIQDRDNITVLVAGTDGTDGPTNAAGGIVDASTFSSAPAAREALQKADAGSYLAQQGGLFVTGPTNTNVMDLVIAIIE